MTLYSKTQGNEIIVTTFRPVVDIDYWGKHQLELGDLFWFAKCATRQNRQLSFRIEVGKTLYTIADGVEYVD